MDLYIQENGTKLSKEKNHFVISNEKGTQKLAVDTIDSIIIQGRSSLTTDFISLMIENKIPIYLADYFGNIYGKVWSNSLDSSAILRRQQIILFQGNYGKKLIKKWIIRKIETQKKHLLKILRRKSLDASEIQEYFQSIEDKINLLELQESHFHETLLGYEGLSSRYYYKILKDHIPATWKFHGRKNYGARDPYNVVLNYLFGVLYSKVEQALVLAGFDVKIGILHGESRKADSLLFDFIEIFRFLVFETCFSLFSKKLINKSFFNEEGRILLEGKKIILSEFYKKLRTTVEQNGEKISYENLIKKEAKFLAKEVLTHEMPDFI
ncbi:CRISPR-associated endonuclease Cas1 [Fusobacterium necrophorum]|nr:CRISPR-associated endonuclease Cas1 [Fusobacterium necrophorum]AYZ72647.1 CRISPR-associated endonuclease Cas1 [Fusobacterium necrophorum]AZW09357.1 CRISPR-associated endonuclease Cas1 [Fusobacterium necrophorum subsp. necrophorum]EYD68943.1 CRISPR-associated protein Cas1 [Fusobacterium necrophorum subsp. funduliforme B35]KDE63551.1 hypothetical protein FUSO3_05015 [Fusobacterium necrophorum BL]KDE68971.1 hypothetical protein FUSO6_07405 [Fusobacterium necrophorum DAB]